MTAALRIAALALLGFAIGTAPLRADTKVVPTAKGDPDAVQLPQYTPPDAYRDTSSATSPNPSIAKRTRSPGAGNLVVMLLPVIAIMSRASMRPRLFRRFASHATASSGCPSASPVLP